MPRMARDQRGDPRGLRKVGAKSENFTERLSRTLSVKGQWNRSHFSMTKWESEKHKGGGIPGEVFKGHVATDGSQLGTAGKRTACGWAVVQLDYDEEMGSLHGMFGSMEAEFEVQRTIGRTELTAFLCLLTRVIGPIKVHVDNKRIIGGLCESWRCRFVDQDLGKNCTVLPHEILLWRWIVSRQHRTKKDVKYMPNFEKFVTEGNEKTDGLATPVAMLDGGYVAEARAKTMQQGRESFAVRSQLSLLGGGMERL